MLRREVSSKHAISSWSLMLLILKCDAQKEKSPH